MEKHSEEKYEDNLVMYGVIFVDDESVEFK